MPVEHRLYEGERIGAVDMFRQWFVKSSLSASDLKRTLAARSWLWFGSARPVNGCIGTVERTVVRRARHHTRMTMDLESLQAELEQLFTLEELVQLSRDFLGMDPDVVGGTSGIGVHPLPSRLSPLSAWDSQSSRAAGCAAVWTACALWLWARAR